MDSTSIIAKQASSEIETFLLTKPETLAVINVEEDKHFQKKDIDLLWIYKFKGKEYMKRVEIKADRYSHTGNYFLETVSNQEKNTKGCFLYTEADLLFYYFIDRKEINSIPMPQAREWFLANQERFIEKELQTEVGNGAFYTSKGRLVKKSILNKEVKGVKVLFIKDILKKKRGEIYEKL